MAEREALLPTVVVAKYDAVIKKKKNRNEGSELPSRHSFKDEAATAISTPQSTPLNTSQPVSSQIGAVSFGFLPSADIRRLSAKQITSANTFDTLLNPVPGGLYSAELGQFGDNACATCGLKNPQCPPKVV